MTPALLGFFLEVELSIVIKIYKKNAVIDSNTSF